MIEVINKSDIYDYIHEGFGGNQILDMIVFNEILTVKAIPLDRVKQAREEMKECSYSLSCFNADVFDEDEKVVDLDNVLIILDKLIESEDKK